jgi:hypothetical protein
MLPEILLPIIFGFVFIFIVPQLWKEENSWWFAILKFWFGILPFMFAAAGIFVMFLGPIYALAGLFYIEYLPVTLLYVYMFVLAFTYERVLTDEQREKIETL